MKKKTLFQIAAVVLFLLFFPGINITHSNILEKRDKELIRIAYMNGSVEALKLDIEKIKKIKSDDELFKSVVYAAADNYVKIVDSLTKRRYTIVNSRGSTHTVKTGRKRINNNYRSW
jgi:hypothetical protein